MNTKLLKKVEELTLYLIEQNKRLEDQQERIPPGAANPLAGRKP